MEMVEVLIVHMYAEPRSPQQLAVILWHPSEPGEGLVRKKVNVKKETDVLRNDEIGERRLDCWLEVPRTTYFG